MATSDAARELALFIENDADLYRQQTLPIITNLQKKFTKGTYDHAKAVKLWKYLADNGAKKYTFDFDDRQGKRYWHEIAGFGVFTVQDRKEAAEQLADSYLEHVEQGYQFKSKARAKNPIVDKRGNWLDMNIKKLGMDANGNHSVWVSVGGKRAIKIQTLHNLPILHRERVINNATIAEIEQYLYEHTRAANPASRSGVKIVHNKLLGGWFIVRGAHHTPISGRFDTKAEAQAHLNRGSAKTDRRYTANQEYTGHASGKPRYVVRFAGTRLADFGSKREAENYIEQYEAQRMTNPAPRIGTARPRRLSQITKKPPSKRLVKRRMKNTDVGYFPNPLAVSEKAKYAVYQTSAKGVEMIAMFADWKTADATAKLYQQHASKGVDFHVEAI